MRIKLSLLRKYIDDETLQAIFDEVDPVVVIDYKCDVDIQALIPNAKCFTMDDLRANTDKVVSNRGASTGLEALGYVKVRGVMGHGRDRKTKRFWTRPEHIEGMSSGELYDFYISETEPSFL